MSRDHDDVKLGDIDDLDLDLDEPAPPARPGKARRSGGGKRGAGGGRPNGRTAPSRRGGCGWIVAVLALLVLLILSSGYLYLQIDTLQARLDNRQIASSAQLDRLKSQLSESGESSQAVQQSLDQQDQALDQQSQTLEKQDEQIRKLWDVSNKRNKGWIQDNQKAIKDLRGDLEKRQQAIADVGTNIAALKKSVAANGAAMQKVRTRMATLEKALTQAQQSLDGSDADRRTRINQMQTRLDATVDALSQLRKESEQQQTQMKKLQQSLAGSADLDQRLDKMQQAIKAFDKYRLEVNRRLDRLQ